MTGIEVLDFARESIWVLFKISLPLLLTGLIVGLIIAILQTLTQIQEATLTFVPKIIIVFLLLLFIFPYIGDVMALYTANIADRIISFGAN